MALSQTQVSQLFVAIFGRASEGDGNKYWQNQGTMQEVAAKMLATEDAVEYFSGAVDTDKDFIEFIYLNVFNKTYEDDAAGIDHWVLELSQGKTRAEVIADMIVAAQDPENAGDAQDLFNNKVALSDYMADNVAKTLDDYKTKTTFKNAKNENGAFDITSDKASLEAAKKAVDSIVAGSISGKVEYLTVGSDKLEGTDGDDLFIARVEQNGNGNESNTLGSGDVIKGNGGNDTLKAEIVTAYNIASKTKDIKPVTVDVENIEITVQSNDETDKDGNNSSLATIDAANMNGVKKISSIGSNGDLLVKNMMGSNNVVDKNGFVTEKVYDYSTKDQTVEFAYSGNKDSNWNEANMTVFYDQDYLVRESIDRYSTTMEIRVANAFKNKDKKLPLDGFKSIILTLGDKKLPVDISSAEILSENAAYFKVIELINAAVKAEGGDWEQVEATQMKARELFFSEEVQGENGNYFPTESAGTYLPILLTYKGSKDISFDKAIFESKNNITDGNRVETSIINPVYEINEHETLSINVDLEKVGNAADGGALVIGSMNKNANNKFNEKQAITVTDTVAGFDEFNVSVKGDKSKNSSLSKLISTDNTLRKVTIASELDKNAANLTIGNSHTGNDITDSATAAAAFKDVQVMDASKFNGNLELNAGFTKEIVAKYLKNEGKVSFKKDTQLSFNGEKALFDYKGGSGADELNLFLDGSGTGIFANAFNSGTNTNTNVFEMNINGGAGKDEITVKFDTDDLITYKNVTNITINGGAGDDTINIKSAATKATFKIAFDGDFGHDTILGFNAGEITKTDEKQDINLSGFTAHAGEAILITIGEEQYTYTVKNNDLGASEAGIMSDVEIAAKVKAMLDADTVFTTTNNSGATLDFEKTGVNVESVKVEIVKAQELKGTFAKDYKTSHSAVANTKEEGGLLSGEAGADVLDFKAYDVKGIVSYENTINTSTYTKVKDLGATVAGDKILALIESTHKQGVYDVYETTYGKSAKDIVAENNVKGSIDFTDTGDVNFVSTLDASQLLF